MTEQMSDGKEVDMVITLENHVDLALFDEHDFLGLTIHCAYLLTTCYLYNVKHYFCSSKYLHILWFLIVQK